MGAEPAPDGEPGRDDRSPRVRRPDTAEPDPEASAGGKSDGAESFLPPELELADILPFTPQLGGAPVPDVAAPEGPAPDGQAMADYGRRSGGPWPLVMGLAVTLALLALGTGLLWWRNRDSRYWPA